MLVGTDVCAVFVWEETRENLLSDSFFFFREELKTSQDEIDRVKDEYIKISEGTERMKEEINRQYQTKIEENVQEVGEHYFVTNNF